MILEERKLGYTYQRYSTDRIRSKFNPIHSQTGYQNSKKKKTNSTSSNRTIENHNASSPTPMEN